MRQRRLVAVVVALVFLVGCAGLQVLSKEEVYFKALGVWYDAGMQFKFYYEKADQETRAKWDEEFRPVLVKSKEVLNLWNFHLQTDQEVGAEIESWKRLKNELIYYIATQMKKEAG